MNRRRARLRGRRRARIGIAARGSGCIQRAGGDDGLADAGGQKEAGKEEKAHGMLVLADVDVERGGFELLLDAGVISGIARSVAGVIQIGRASCRERV